MATLDLGNVMGLKGRKGFRARLDLKGLRGPRESLDLPVTPVN